MTEPEILKDLRLEPDFILEDVFDKIESVFIMHPEVGMSITLEELRSEYARMTDYWKQGYPDDTRQAYYNRIAARTQRLIANIRQRYAIIHTPRLNSEYNNVRKSGKDWSMENIRKSLERFVSEMTMTDLLPENKRKERQAQLLREQHTALSQIFDYIRTSEQWSESTATAMEELLLSPTVDTMTQQTLIAAVILNCLCWFDYQKERMMINVYMKSSNELVRQRALVGWVLCLDSTEYEIADTEHENLIGKLLEDKHCIEELNELQIQLALCLSAEKDKSEISHNIMPDIVNNSPVKIKNGIITEIDDDNIEDIIDPEAAERKMEVLEEKMRRIMEMQRQGHDIFYGGFSQMKRFRFFDTMMHWVMPFYKENPEVTATFSDKKHADMLIKMLDNAPFCDSDRYSFMLALQQVIGSFPPNIIEAMNSGEMQVLGSSPADASKKDDPAIIRRNFLQCLYRFFNVYQGRDLFPKVFTNNYARTLVLPKYLFFAQSIFADTPLQESMPQMAMAFIKRGMWQDAITIMGNYNITPLSYSANMTMARLFPEEDLKYFQDALEQKPGDEKALRGMARGLFRDKRYSESFEIYDTLSEKFPDNRKLLLCRVAAMIYIPEHFDEAKAILFRLEYEDPDNIYICRLLAQVLFKLGQTEQAQKMFARLYNGGKCADEDKINYGIFLLSERKFEDAAKALEGMDRKLIAEALEDEHETLARKDITPLDIKLFKGLLK